MLLDADCASPASVLDDPLAEFRVGIPFFLPGAASLFESAVLYAMVIRRDRLQIGELIIELVFVDVVDFHILIRNATVRDFIEKPYRAMEKQVIRLAGANRQVPVIYHMSRYGALSALQYDYRVFLVVKTKLELRPVNIANSVCHFGTSFFVVPYKLFITIAVKISSFGGKNLLLDQLFVLEVFKSTFQGSLLYYINCKGS